MFSELFNYINSNLHSFLGRNYTPTMATIVLIITLSVSYSFFSYFLKKSAWTTDKKRKLAINVRNSLGFFFIISLIFIWSGELKTMILTITALVAAMLIAYKEVFLSFAGSFFITSEKVFSLGEYIEIDGVKGKVIDKNFVFTKILISEAFQTREMNIPNISFITGKVTNLSKYGKFQSFTLKLTVPSLAKINEYATEVDGIAKRALSTHHEKYTQYFEVKRKSDIFFEAPNKHYHIDYDLSDFKNPLIKLHYLAHPLDQKDIEEKIFKEYILKLEKDTIY